MQYESAREAFLSLGANKRLSKALVSQTCRRIANVYGVKMHGGPAETMAHMLFKNTVSDLQIFIKSVRVVQVGSKVVFFSDVYHARGDAIEAFAERCRSAGIPVSHFEKRYPQTVVRDTFEAPKASIMNLGYAFFYRGTLSGVVVG